MSDKPVVCVKRYRSSPESLREVVEGCGGFSGLRPSDRVVVKPNLVAWDPDYPFAPYGVYTTSRLLEDLVLLLKDAGAGTIAVAEGSVRLDDQDPGTARIFEKLGFERLRREHGVRLVDLVDGPFTAVDLCGHEAFFATSVLEADFLVNLPVLKTHSQTRLSSGLKNLKGCLDMKSRRLCHHREIPLDDFVAALAGVVRPALTVVDGIYGLERGPFFLGKARRMNVLAASRDPLGADATAARLAGMHPADVPHLARTAERAGRSLEPGAVELVGDPIDDLTRPLEWDFRWDDRVSEDPVCSGPPQWKPLGFAGLSMPKYDETLCTGCSAIYNPLALLLTSAFTGEPFDRIQVLTGKKIRPAPGFKTTLLVGNCMIKRNRDHPDRGEGVLVPGCPPTMKKMLAALHQVGLEPHPEMIATFREGLVARYQNDADFDPRHFFLPPAEVPGHLLPGG